jgi:hypothetical protein
MSIDCIIATQNGLTNEPHDKPNMLTKHQDRNSDNLVPLARKRSASVEETRKLAKARNV